MSHLLLFWFQKRTVAIDTLPEIIGFSVFQDILTKVLIQRFRNPIIMSQLLLFWIQK